MNKITAIIPTLNEEIHIADAIKSVSFADEVIVIDSFSSDKTIEIVKQSKAILLQRKFDDFSKQKNLKNNLIHKTIINDVQQLFSAAQKDGLEFTIVSSYRTFEQQLTIWNEKWLGHRPVYSLHGRPLNITKMSDMEKYKAISLWSALPGLSRHHWGSDLDIFLTKAIQQGHKVELSPQEFSDTGVCYQLNCWMDKNLKKFGFFKPYREYRQGVSAEPWHISHRLVSDQIIADFPYIQCLEYIRNRDIKAKDFICDIFEHYREQYFLNVCD